MVVIPRDKVKIRMTGAAATDPMTQSNAVVVASQVVASGNKTVSGGSGFENNNN